MYIDRPTYLKLLISQKDNELIKVITGVRRCGKSILLFELFYNYLLQQNISSENIIRINLEDKENDLLRSADNLYEYVKSKSTNQQKKYILIDEIQYVEHFEDLVNSWKNKGFDVYITGSNSRFLSKDINTALRGRSIEIHIYPFSFAEYYSIVNGNERQAFNQFMKFGGYPFSAKEQSEDNKIKYLQMIEQTVATNDIIERYKIRNIQAFKAVYSFLCSNIGSLVNSKKIADYLRSVGYKTATPDTVGNYIEYLCDAFLFYKAVRYDIKGKEYLKTLNKYYICDVGLRNAKMNFRQIEIPHILENIVYLELVKQGYIVDIGKNNSKEIDFIAQKNSQRLYIQVAYSIIDPEKKEQEISSFKGLDDGYKKIVLTMDDDPFTELGNGYKKIYILDFLLNRVFL